jgi:hypothetical protein
MVLEIHYKSIANPLEIVSKNVALTVIKPADFLGS